MGSLEILRIFRGERRRPNLLSGPRESATRPGVPCEPGRRARRAAMHVGGVDQTALSDPWWSREPEDRGSPFRSPAERLLDGFEISFPSDGDVAGLRLPRLRAGLAQRRRESLAELRGGLEALPGLTIERLPDDALDLGTMASSLLLGQVKAIAWPHPVPCSPSARPESQLGWDPVDRSRSRFGASRPRTRYLSRPLSNASMSG